MEASYSHNVAYMRNEINSNDEPFCFIADIDGKHIGTSTHAQCLDELRHNLGLDYRQSFMVIDERLHL